MSLSTEFVIRGSLLRDVSLETEHRLRPGAERLLRKLRSEVQLSELQRLALRLGISDEQLYEMLGFLNMIGALVRKQRSPGSALDAMFKQLRLLVIGIRYAALTWRKPATISSILHSLVFACLPVVLAIATVSTLFAVSGLTPAFETPLLATCIVVAFIGSMYVHELAHLTVIQYYTVTCAVLRSGMRIGIIHQTLSPKAETYSALSGPLAGIVSCVAMACLAFLLGLSVLGTLVLGVGIIHLSSLLPWYGDGRSLKLARQRSMS